MVSFSERRAGEGLICIEEVRITMIQGFTNPGCAIDMLIEFRDSYFPISLVKIPSYNEWSLRICGFQFYIESNKVCSGPTMCLLGGEYIRL